MNITHRADCIRVVGHQYYDKQLCEGCERPSAAPVREPPSAENRPSILRKDLAKLLDSLYGLHVGPGHIDTVLEVVNLHAPIKTPVSAAPVSEEMQKALRYAIALVRGRIPVEAPMNAEICKRYADDLDTLLSVRERR